MEPQTMQPEPPRYEWVSAAAAARLAGTTPEVIRRLAKQGFISVRKLPGCDPRYLMTEVERIVQGMTASASRVWPDQPAPAPSDPGTARLTDEPTSPKGGA
jgi:hypothetical protein